MNKRLLDLLTGLSGVLTLLAATPYDKELVQVIPPAWTPWLIKVGLIATLLLRVLAYFAPPTPSPNINFNKSSEPAPTRKLPLIAVFIGLGTLSAVTATACAGLKAAWGTSDSRKATIAKLEGVAVNILGRVAVAELQSLATDNGSDFAHSAATAAWSSLRVSDLADVLTSEGATSQLADSAAAFAAKAVAGGVSRQDALNAVASAISSAALK